LLPLKDIPFIISPLQAKLTVNEDAAGTATAATVGPGAAATWSLLGSRSRTARGLAMILPPMGKRHIIFAQQIGRGAANLVLLSALLFAFDANHRSGLA
jgi:hypothetical protein